MAGQLKRMVYAHALKDRKDDLYQTPPVAVHALCRVEPLPKAIWEPACGPGSIARELRAAGHHVYGTDLVQYEGEHAGEGRRDFLFEQAMPEGIDCIVTNPPFKLGGEFVQHALDIGAQKICMLLRLAFLESEARRPILDSGHLARVYVFRNRLPMMHREDWEGPKASSTIAFAWFVWTAKKQTATELRRISWEADQ